MLSVVSCGCRRCRGGCRPTVRGVGLLSRPRCFMPRATSFVPSSTGPTQAVPPSNHCRPIGVIYHWTYWQCQGTTTVEVATSAVLTWTAGELRGSWATYVHAGWRGHIGQLRGTYTGPTQWPPEMSVRAPAFFEDVLFTWCPPRNDWTQLGQYL